MSSPFWSWGHVQEEELLQEVEQLMDRDAPPDTLGVEILLILGRTVLGPPLVNGPFRPFQEPKLEDLGVPAIYLAYIMPM